MRHRTSDFFVIFFIFLMNCIILSDADSWTSVTAWCVYLSSVCLVCYALADFLAPAESIDPKFKPDLTADDIAHITKVRDEKDHVAAVKCLRERYPRLTLTNANDMVKSL